MVYQNIEVDIIEGVDRSITADPSLPPFQKGKNILIPHTNYKYIIIVLM